MFYKQLYLLNVLQHPRVRYAACNAMGQMCTDFGPVFQKKFHQKVCSMIVSVEEIFMPPFEKGGAYCFAPVGRYVGQSVCRYPLTLCN